MRKIRVAINGFGRIGRLTANRILQYSNNIEIVAINDLANNDMIAHLWKYDTAQGIVNAKIRATEDAIYYNDIKIKAFAEKDPTQLPWKKLDVDVVAECTGVFRTEEKASRHLTAGAKKVVLSAPAKSKGVKTVVLGVNDNEINGEFNIISNASCTTNCLAPIVKILHEKFGIVQGFMTTVHAYTADQRLQDAPHKDWRRARAAAQNIIPTTTGAAKALGLVYPAVKGKIKGTAVRVPVITGSLTELTVMLENETSKEEINKEFEMQCATSFKNIVEYSDGALVSSDIVGNPYSSIFDAPLTKVNGKLVKLTSWYDNEYGYAARMKDLIEVLGRFL